MYFGLIPIYYSYATVLAHSHSRLIPILLYLDLFPFPFSHSFPHRVYFKVVLQEGKKDIISDLVSILMERVLCLYKNQSFQDEVRK